MLLYFIIRYGDWLVWLIFALYAVIMAGMIISDNRLPQSTFAWIFFLLLFPALGLVFYWFFGRNHKVFRQERRLAHLELGGPLTMALKPMMDREYDYVSMIQQEKPVAYRRRLLHMVFRNSASSLTGYNQVEILQNAVEKYPSLLEDIHNAQHSIHLEYFI